MLSIGLRSLDDFLFRQFNSSFSPGAAPSAQSSEKPTEMAHQSFLEAFPSSTTTRPLQNTFPESWPRKAEGTGYLLQGFRQLLRAAHHTWKEVRGSTHMLRPGTHGDMASQAGLQLPSLLLPPQRNVLEGNPCPVPTRRVTCGSTQVGRRSHLGNLWQATRVD